VAVHIAFAAAIIFFPSTRRGAVIDPDAIAVSLTGGIAAPETRVRKTAPPPEERPAPPPEAVPEGASLEPKQIKITKKPRKKKPAAEKTPPPEPDPGTATGDPGIDTGGVSGGSSIASLNLDDVALARYASFVTASLRANWIRPPLANVHDELSVIVAFEIQRNGSVRNLRIESSSGVPSLDRSAVRAVSDAVPLPGFPASVGSASLPARFEFTWYPGAD
jgi:protein TonB